MTTAPDWDQFFRGDADGPTTDDPGDGAAHLLDLVAAVEFLRRGDRTDLTVWDALEEAIRWWTAERVSAIDGVPDPDIADLAWNDPDALDRALRRLTDALDRDATLTADVALQQAVRRWCSAMSLMHNDEAPWRIPLVRSSDHHNNGQGGPAPGDW